LAEIRLGDIEELEHRGRDVVLVLEKAIVDILDVVGEFSERVEADHAAAALDRMKLPARRAQRLAVAGVAPQLGAIFEDRVEHLGRLDQKISSSSASSRLASVASSRCVSATAPGRVQRSAGRSPRSR
jgi:hypothetical protein